MSLLTSFCNGESSRMGTYSPQRKEKKKKIKKERRELKTEGEITSIPVK